MPRKVKTSTEQYEFLSLNITDFKIIVDGAINHEVRVLNQQYDDAKIYKYGTHIDIEGVCTYPDERTEEFYFITIYGHETKDGMFESKLSEYHAHDEDCMPQYRKSKGRQVPLYKPPKGVGILERQRGTKKWMGSCWLPPQTVSDITSLLIQIKPLYASIHELKEGRSRWIVGLSVQTSDPAEE